MAGPDHPPQRFSEEEVQLLLRKAIERQEADRAQHAHLHDGLTLDEIQHIAAEAGIEPRYVAAALADLKHPATPSAEIPFYGGPVTFSMTRTLPGKLTVEKIATLTAAIREAFEKDRGHLEVLGNRFEWTTSRQSGDGVYVRAQSEGEQTTMRLGYNLSNQAVVYFLPSLMVMMLALPVLFVDQNVLIGSLLIVLAILATFGMRLALNAYARGKIRKLEALADEMGTLMEAAEATPIPEATSIPDAPQPLPEAPRTSEKTPPLFDLDAAEEPSADAPTRPRRSIYGSLD